MLHISNTRDSRLFLPEGFVAFEPAAVMNSTPPAMEALRTHMANMVYGYDPHGNDEPGSEITDYYYRRYGGGNSRQI